MTADPIRAEPDPAGDARDDFIAVTPHAIGVDVCTAIVARLQQSDALQPGRVGSGVFPELKRSRDLQVTGKADWADVEQTLNVAVYAGLLAYLRRWPQVLIAPLMLQQPDARGTPRRLAAEDIATMDDKPLGELARTCLRPGTVNLQWYRDREGGYPYWHCELYPRDARCETLHRHLLWTIYLNDDFDEGETEFLFQQRKITPQTGALLIAPTAFTHTHRGNRPQGGDKFIATSWILFQRSEAMFGG